MGLVVPGPEPGLGLGLGPGQEQVMWKVASDDSAALSDLLGREGKGGCLPGSAQTQPS